MNYKLMLIEGLSDAAGFLIGALMGAGVGMVFGWDIYDASYSNSNIVSVVLVVLGGGFGLQMVRRWRNRSKPNPDRTGN